WGLVHLVLAYLALRVAFGAGAREADQRGALQEIGSTSFGQGVLWVLAVGLIAFGLWEFVHALSGRKTTARVGAVARGVGVIALGVTAVRLATGSGAAGSDQVQQEATGKLLRLPAGPFLVTVAAAVVLGVAIAAVVKGAKKSFLDDLDQSDLPAGTRTAVVWLGRVGYFAKGAVYVEIAALLAYAGLRSDARQAGGLDKALRTLAARPFGVVALAVVALGLAAFGVYCFAAARARRG
ncbi:DUF1206 domain-containing protein, partial [Amycolatopsis acidicola]